MSEASTRRSPKPSEVFGKKVRPEGITTVFEEITPKVAEAYLERNTKNRLIREGKVEGFVRDLKNGDFVTTHQGIAFDVDNVLMDGQHRLLAIIRSGVSVVMAVTRGLPEDVKPTIDVGATRTIADVLKFEGYDNRMILGAIARLCLLYDQETTLGNYARAVTRMEIMGYLAEHEEELIGAAHLAARWAQQMAFPPSVVGACYVIYSRINSDEAFQFFSEMAELNLGGGDDPRTALIRRITATKQSREPVQQVVWFSAMNKVWNAWRTGGSLQRVQLDRVKTKRVIEAV